MKKWILWTACGLLAAVTVTIGHGQEQKDDLKALMKRKLEASQKILEGVALNDFDVMRNNADELIRVSKATEFRVLKTAQYEVYSNELRRAAENLGVQAQAKNLDGAALAYVDLTLTCVKCHKHVREIRMAKG